MKQKITFGFIGDYIMPFLVIAFTFLAPTFYWIGSIGFFITCDLMLRILLCLKNKQEIYSSRLWKTVYKFGAGMIFIFVAFACEKMFLPNVPFLEIIGGYLILVELKSIDEKAQEWTGYSLFSLVVEKLMPKKENGQTQKS